MNKRLNQSKIQKFLNPQRVAGLSILLMSLIITSPALAQQCKQDKRGVEVDCFEKPMAQTYPTGGMDAIAKMTSIKEMGAALSSTATDAAVANRQAAASCRAANNRCQKSCKDEIERELKKIPPAQYPNQQVITDAQNNMERCKSDSEKLSAEYDAQAAKLAEEAGAAAETSGSAEATPGGEPGADMAPATDAPAADAAGGGGGGGQMLGALAAVGAGAGLLCVMGTICKPAEDPSGTGSTPGAYSPKQCAEKEDAYKKDSCTDLFLSNCKDNLTDARCEKFVGHYCGTNTETPPQEDSTNPSSLPNEGVGSPFCQLALSDKYCRSSGQPSCPSCANLTRMKSCTDAPQACLPQMTQADKEQAKVTCPTDPLFANPAFMAQTESSTDDLGNVSVAPGAEDGGTVTASFNGSGGANQNAIDAYSEGGVTGNSGQAAGHTSAGAASSGSSQVGGISDSAGVGSRAGFRGPSSHEQVAPGIAPAIGSSLFARHSKVVHMRCAQGAVNNCGPRSVSSR